MPDRYDILDEIGRGGFGVVYRARDQKLGRTVALKMLREDHLRDEKMKQRFRREAKAVARLDHPHIVPVHDFGLDDEVPFLVMPYVKGPTLGERIAEERRLPEDKTIRIGRALSQALGYVHKEGVVHRDVKSDNVLMDGEQPRLTDFGIALLRERTRLTSGDGRMGTPAYMSPEQLEGREVGPRSDVYSLGVVLYECLSGRLPYEGKNMMQIIYAMARGEREPLEGVAPGASSWLIEVVKRCLAEAPGDRYERAAALSKALSEGEDGQLSLGLPTVELPSVKKAAELPLPNEVKMEKWPDALDPLRKALEHPEEVTSLDLGFSQLETIPSAIGQLRKLKVLYLSNNPITKLPTTIGDLCKLERFHIQNTELNQLPESIGQLSNLFALDATDSDLLELPLSIGEMTYLGWLVLENNRLTVLPSSIGELSSLKVLSLEGNDIEELPESVVQLTNLESLNLRGNPLRHKAVDTLRRELSDTRIRF
jgi:serine/threonine-protein kinase